MWQLLLECATHPTQNVISKNHLMHAKMPGKSSQSWGSEHCFWESHIPQVGRKGHQADTPRAWLWGTSPPAEIQAVLSGWRELLHRPQSSWWGQTLPLTAVAAAALLPALPRQGWLLLELVQPCQKGERDSPHSSSIVCGCSLRDSIILSRNQGIAAHPGGYSLRRGKGTSRGENHSTTSEEEKGVLKHPLAKFFCVQEM